jgi:hypothetical protein
METFIAEAAEALDRGLRHVVAGFGARLEFAARHQRPLEALAEDNRREREERALRARRDFERAWKTF